MYNKDILLRTDKETNLGSNSDYFKYIFKKTEKISCAVFYVVRSNKDIDRNDTTVRNVEDVAHKLMRSVIVSLKSRGGDNERAAQDVGYALVELESALRIAHAAGILETDHLHVFLTELDSVLRALKPYTESKLQDPFFHVGALESSLREQARTHTRPAALRTLSGANDDLLATPQKSEDVKADRSKRILAVLKDRGQASIKDISNVIKDCSEKTIQRELNILIKDNKVIRDGERRWSRYIPVTAQL